MRNIYSKLRKAVVYGNARTGDSIFGNLGLGSVLISVIILFSLRSGRLFGSLSCFLGSFSCFLGSLSSCFFFFSLCIGISCDPCSGITERYYSRVVHTKLFALFLFPEKQRHFLFVCLDYLLGETRLTLLTGDLLQIRHHGRPVEACNVLGLQKIDAAACFLFVFSAVDNLIIRRRYQCYIHSPLSQTAAPPRSPLYGSGTPISHIARVALCKADTGSD